MIQIDSSKNTNHILRLEPGEDLKKTLLSWVKEKNIQAGFCVSVLGSLNQACLRTAGANESLCLDGPLEILSLNGTISTNGAHLHICLSDSKSHTFGGHLLEGSIIFTTVEILIIEFLDIEFSRKLDLNTGYQELNFRPK